MEPGDFGQSRDEDSEGEEDETQEESSGEEADDADEALFAAAPAPEADPDPEPDPEPEPEPEQLVEPELEPEAEPEPAKLKEFGQMEANEQDAVIQLGWTAESWDLGEDTPFETAWEKLGAARQEAAGRLGMAPAEFGEGREGETEEESGDDEAAGAGSGSGAGDSLEALAAALNSSPPARDTERKPLN
eukprot:COSAG04_NODE_9758_length_834_cov_1.678912_1_plen_188_part_10